jgi:hypothetical protein
MPVESMSMPTRVLERLAMGKKVPGGWGGRDATL